MPGCCPRKTHLISVGAGYEVISPQYYFGFATQNRKSPPFAINVLLIIVAQALVEPLTRKFPKWACLSAQLLRTSCLPTKPMLAEAT